MYSTFINIPLVRITTTYWPDESLYDGEKVQECKGILADLELERSKLPPDPEDDDGYDSSDEITEEQAKHMEKRSNNFWETVRWMDELQELQSHSPYFY